MSQNHPPQVGDPAAETVNSRSSVGRNPELATLLQPTVAETMPRTVAANNLVAWIATGLLLVFLLFFSWDVWRREYVQLLDGLRITATVEARSLELLFRHYEQVLSALRDDLFDADGNLLSRELSQTEIGNTLRRIPDWSAMTIRTVDGILVLNSTGDVPNPEVRGYKTASRDWAYTLIELNRGVNMSIGRGVSGALTGDWVLPLRYAVRDREGKLTYVITTAIPLSRPLSVWEGIAFPGTAGIGVILLQDEVYSIARFPQPAKREFQQEYGNPRRGPFAQAMLRGKLPPLGHYEAVSTITNVDTVFSYARLTHYPLVFTVRAPRVEIWARWWAQVRYVYAAFGLAMLAGIFALRWVGQRDREVARRRSAIEEKLRASESFFRAMFEQAGVGIGIREVDSSRRFVRVNQKLCDILGYTMDEMLDKSARDLLPKSATGRGIAIQRVIAGEIDEDIVEQTYIGKDGREVWASRTLSTIRGPDGKAEFLIVMLTDMNARRQADLDLLRSQQRLSEAEALAHLGSWEQDLDTDQSIWSAEMYRIFGREPYSVNPDYEFRSNAIHPEDRASVFSAVSTALDTGVRFSAKYRVVWPDGSVRHVMSEGDVEQENGRAVRMRGYALDITERARIQSELEASVRDKETLLREIHHRVKNNLQIVSSLLHFQSKKVRHADDLAVFSEGRDRLRSMMLIHEKLYQSHNMSEIDFADYVNALVLQVGESYQSLHSRVSVRVQAVETRLPIDIALPCGMLVNELLSNVFKYAFPRERGGEVVVTIGAAAGCMTMVVADNGVGLPPGLDVERPQSFGLQLIRNLASQIEAELKFESGTGVRVEVRVPMPMRSAPRLDQRQVA